MGFFAQSYDKNDLFRCANIITNGKNAQSYLSWPSIMVKKQFSAPLIFLCVLITPCGHKFDWQQ